MNQKMIDLQGEIENEYEYNNSSTNCRTNRN